MFDMNNPETFWLNVTNIGLGLVTAICVFVFAKALYSEIAERVRARVTVPDDDHSFVHADLGITMADGGEPVKKPEQK